MPFELRYADRGFTACFTGKVTIHQLNEANGRIHGHHEFDFHKYQIVDLLDADLSSVTDEDTEFPAVADAIASKTAWGVRVALIGKDDYTLNIINRYVEHARRLVPKWDFAVFNARLDALRWAKSRSERVSYIPDRI